MSNKGCSVSILCDSLEGGLGQAVLSEVNYLLNIGWRVMLSAPVVPGAIELKAGISFTKIPVPTAIRNLIGMLHSVLTFRQRLMGFTAPNLVHAYGLRSFVIARLAFPLTPVVVTFLGGPPSGWIRQIVFRLIAKISAGAITVAPLSVPGWQHWWHWSPVITATTVESQGNGMSMTDRAIEPSSANKAGAYMTLGWLGRFEFPKRPDKWLAALARAQERGIDIRGVMAGDGPLLAQTRREALKLNLDIDFLGWQTTHSAIFSRIDALLTWSDSEGVPFVLQEAIWAGIPCIANDLPGPAVFLGVGSLGVVDEDSIVGVLESLTDPKFRSGLQLDQFKRLKFLLAEGRPEEKFASRYQHFAAACR